MLTQKDILRILDRTPPELKPLSFARTGATVAPDAKLTYDVSWQGKQGYRFVAEVKARATSQALAAAAQQAKSHAFDTRGTFPMVIVPHLSPASIAEVERLGISAVDLCGNGIVQIPQQWLVVRTGQPNRFRGGDPLRGAYRGVASLVARAFLLQPTFARVSDVQSFIESRGASIALGTVSKALTRLAEDLVIARDTTGLRLLQADKLLSRLREGYRPPSIRAKLSLRTGMPDVDLYRRLRHATEALGGRSAFTGISSASYQTVIAGDPVASLYCSMPPEELAVAASIDPTPDRHFATLELLQTDDPRVYFDTRDHDGRSLSSPLQTWLELATGDKRSEEVAKDLAARLLREVSNELNGSNG